MFTFKGNLIKESIDSIVLNNFDHYFKKWVYPYNPRLYVMFQILDSRFNLPRFNTSNFSCIMFQTRILFSVRGHSYIKL